MHQDVSQKKNVAHLIKNSIYSLLVHQDVLNLVKFVLMKVMSYVVKNALNLNKNAVKSRVKNILSVNTLKSAPQVHAVIQKYQKNAMENVLTLMNIVVM